MSAKKTTSSSVEVVAKPTTLKTAKAKKKEPLAIPKMGIKSFQVEIVSSGEPITVHAWSKKAVQEMLDKQLGKPKAKKKDPKNPVMDFFQSLYWLEGFPGGKGFDDLDPEDYDGANKAVEGHRFGFPTIAFKNAMVSACRNIEGVTMATARGAFHVVSDIFDPREGRSMVELMDFDGKQSLAPQIRQDMVRIGQGTADIRYRGMFSNWRARLDINYNSGVMTPEQIVNLLNIAGFAVGVGEHRPEKNGQWGMFQVTGA